MFGLKEAATPNYKVYTALLTQEDENDPTAIVLENTTGLTISFLRDSPGIYVCTISDAFPNTKIVVFLSPNDENNYGFAWWVTNSPDQLLVKTKNTSMVNSDNILAYTSIEIRVYN